MDQCVIKVYTSPMVCGGTGIPTRQEAYNFMRTFTHRLGVAGALGVAVAVALSTAVSASAEAQNGPHDQTAAAAAAAAVADPIQVYGAWLCGSDQCTWATAPDMTTFDTQNHWLIDRGNGSPSVNLVVLSFADPLKLLNGTTDAGDTNGVPNGMDQSVVSYFTSHGVRVMLSLGGITYTADWDCALTQNATLLAQKAAALATQLGVGIEIDYENSSSPNLTGMQSFISAYRAAHPYDATGAAPSARPTIDLAAGDRYLIGLDQYATANWLTTTPYSITRTPWSRASSPRPAARSPTGSSTSTASPTTARRSAPWPRRSSPAPSTSPARALPAQLVRRRGRGRRDQSERPRADADATTELTQREN